MKQFKRSQRLGVQIQKDISDLLEQELAEHFPGMVTFTHVKLSDDLRHANVYYSYLGSDDDRARIEEFFLRERGRIRSQVGRRIRVRHIPELNFKFDSSVEHGLRIEQLLNEIHKEHGADGN
jgi:ribosome-binding factor A